MEDSQIVDLYLARDERAVSETAQKYGRRLRQLAQRILDDAQSAEECENDTYHAAWNSIPPHTPRTYLFAFLGRITRHLAIDACRRASGRKRRALLCELTQEMEACIPGGNDAAETVEAEELARAIDAFLGTCGAEQRDMFVRRYWYFDTVRELSARYGCTQSKVKTTLLRLRERLKLYLEKEGYTV